MSRRTGKTIPKSRAPISLDEKKSTWSMAKMEKPDDMETLQVSIGSRSKTSIPGRGIPRKSTVPLYGDVPFKLIGETDLVKKHSQVGPLEKGGVLHVPGYVPPKDLVESKRRMMIHRAAGLGALPPYEISEFLLTPYGPEEIRSMSVYALQPSKGSSKGIDDTVGGLDDPFLGARQGQDCSFCSSNLDACPGHYARIEFGTQEDPIYMWNPIFTGVAVKVLQCVCQDCGSLIIDPAVLKKNGVLDMPPGLPRLKVIYEMSKKMKCSTRPVKGSKIAECRSNPLYAEEKGDFHQINKRSKDKTGAQGAKTAVVLRPEEALKIFKVISPKSLEILGFTEGARPENYLMCNLLVLPPCIISTFSDDTKFRFDGAIYENIAGFAASLRNRRRDSSWEEAYENLAIKVTQLIQPSKENQKTQSKYLSVADKMRGRNDTKEGIFKQAIVGSRVNLAGRTVLSNDPTLKAGEIGIPEYVAKTLTIIEKVAEYNRANLQSMVDKGLVRTIQRVRGTIFNVFSFSDPTSPKPYTLEIGDGVLRPLRTGDYVAFNRQPSLHRFSMLGYRVVITKNKTFGLHLSCVTGHNADFDGDEGVIHVPQSLEAMAELMENMSMAKCLISESNNAPVNGIILDGIAGATMISRSKSIPESIYYGSMLYTKVIYYEKDPYTEIHRWVSPLIKSYISKGVRKYEFAEKTPFMEKLERYGVPIFSGRSLVSITLPEGFNYDHGDVLIRDGIMISGVLNKKTIGISSGSIPHIIALNYSSERAARFITEFSRLTNYWNTHTSLSPGLVDCVLSLKDRKAVREKIAQINRLVADQVSGRNPGVKSGLTAPKDTSTGSDRVKETKIRGLMNTVPLQKISVDSMKESNPLHIMAIAAGSKGAPINVTQIMSVLGQQHVGGERPKKTLTGGTRRSHYFPPGEETPAAGGFCDESFAFGLSREGQFFHNESAREGLVHTSVTTSTGGYIQKQLSDYLSNVVAHYDGTVRGPGYRIIMFRYGSDGFDPSTVMKMSITGQKSKPFQRNNETVLWFMDINRLIIQLNVERGITDERVNNENAKRLFNFFKEQPLVYILETKTGTGVTFFGKEYSNLKTSEITVTSTRVDPETGEKIEVEGVRTVKKIDEDRVKENHNLYMKEVREYAKAIGSTVDPVILGIQLINQSLPWVRLNRVFEQYTIKTIPIMIKDRSYFGKTFENIAHGKFSSQRKDENIKEIMKEMKEYLSDLSESRGLSKDESKDDSVDDTSTLAENTMDILIDAPYLPDLEPIPIIQRTSDTGVKKGTNNETLHMMDEDEMVPLEDDQSIIF